MWYLLLACVGGLLLVHTVDAEVNDNGICHLTGQATVAVGQTANIALSGDCSPERTGSIQIGVQANTPPSIASVSWVDPVPAGGAVTLEASAIDPDIPFGDNLTFIWDVGGNGAVSPSTTVVNGVALQGQDGFRASVTWTPSSVNAAQQISLRVCDDFGGGIGATTCATWSGTINVVAP
ncbi:MAG: hypothetical protein D6761_09005 [Candidatus Dadabacteria bacterium]|nr:MAG: hypothetical protein D6761_09005 [Candidatus Dadabacteria bacterium]